MNYVKEMNALYHFMLRNKLPKSEFALLLALYMINNAEDWVLWFEADNELLQRLTGGYSRDAINTARNGLKQKGRIDFKVGKRNEESAKYSIIPFEEEKAVVSDMKLDMKLDMKPDMKLDMKLDHKTKQKHKLKQNTPPISPAERFEDFLAYYPLCKNRSMTEKAYFDLILSGKYTEDELVKCAQNYAEYVKIIGTDKIYHSYNFLNNMAFEDYLPDRYEKPKPKKQKNSFNDFQQNSYDYDDLLQKVKVN